MSRGLGDVYKRQGDSIVPTRKRQDEANDVQIEVEQREIREEKQKKSTARTQEDSTQGEYAYFRLTRIAGGVQRRDEEAE